MLHVFAAAAPWALQVPLPPAFPSIVHCAFEGLGGLLPGITTEQKSVVVLLPRPFGVLVEQLFPLLPSVLHWFGAWYWPFAATEQLLVCAPPPAGRLPVVAEQDPPLAFAAPE
jgi:hypothetical protein